VRGLRITGASGVNWRGGTLRSQLGEDARAIDGYGAIIRNGDTVTTKGNRVSLHVTNE
jgi:hypothetical protein